MPCAPSSLFDVPLPDHPLFRCSVEVWLPCRMEFGRRGVKAASRECCARYFDPTFAGVRLEISQRFQKLIFYYYANHYINFKDLTESTDATTRQSCNNVDTLGGIREVDVVARVVEENQLVEILEGSQVVLESGSHTLVPTLHRDADNGCLRLCATVKHGQDKWYWQRRAVLDPRTWVIGLQDGWVTVAWEQGTT